MAALELDHVSKRFSIGQGGGLLGGVLGRTRTRRELWALRDLSLSLEAGESVGLIGHNGAGKTTALKLLAGISRPTSGHVRTQGRVASLINLGAGFHPELTGRENILLNGVILGLSRREVRARFDDIVEFADLGPYIDTPLKRYSSGMYARLGFAVAAHVDPDVLLVDEVLSVGDVAFQDRSLRKMLSFRDDGRAILFVSHNLSAVEMMCQRVVWLEHGQVRMAGPTPEVVRAYLDAVDTGLVEDAARTTRLAGDEAEAVALTEVAVLDGAQRLSSEFDYGEPMGVRLRCLASQDVQHVQCSVTVRGDYGPLFTATSETSACWRRGPHELLCAFEYLPLLPGLYRVTVQVRHAGTAAWAVPQTVAAFRVNTDLSAFGSDSLVGATKSRGGFLAVAYDWRVQTSAGEQTLAGLRLPGTHSTMKDRARVVVVMPAYNAARTLEATYRGLAMDVVDEVILVDDVSHDETVDIAERLGLKVVVHVQNRGYGGNQKTCYLEALRSGADVVVMVHPDNQYDSTLVPQMIQPILDNQADIVLGSRVLSGTALSGGMPVWKYVANRFLTAVENVVFGLRLSEYHTGFRAYSRRLLETLPFLLNSDNFVFDQEIMAQAVCFGFRAAEIPVPTRYFAEASSVNFERSVEYGFDVLKLMLRYLLHRAHVVRQRQFTARLEEILAPRHHAGVFRPTRSS